jgi:biopolymer transport protein ExbD
MMASGGGHGPGASQDFDLNLAPIIDCFTVLITFMLVSASFLSIGIIDAGAGAAGQTAASATAPKVTVQVEMSEGHALQVKVTGKATQNRTLASTKEGAWDYLSLTQELAAIKQKWPEVESVVLSAKDNIEYNDVITAMEATKKSIPAVLLGGF